MAGLAFRRKRATRLILAVAVVSVLVVGGGTAAATVIFQDHYSGTYDFTTDECGYDLDVTSEFHGQVVLRVEKGGQAFLVKDKFWYRDVVTNPATGKHFVQYGNGLFHDIKATLVEGTVWEFVSVEAGQPFTIEDSDGNVIVRDRGVIRHTILFDTLGDGQPGGIFLGETDAAVHGPHPGFADGYWCAVAAQLTG